MNTKEFRKTLNAWYRQNSRKNLPWRKTKDPYSIWVSETMLQQTQVVKVIPYYERFLKIFPTVKKLAGSPLTEILDLWAGLGYYSRAKNLHAASQKVVEDYGGKLPEKVDELMKLPGIGRYTAGAVASIAYDRPAPILDGNVIRVLCRYVGIRDDTRLPAVQKKLWALSEQLVPNKSPGDFNQALMELGALICVPRAPLCLLCPLSQGCAARKSGSQEKIPFVAPPLKKKKIYYLCGIIEKENKILLGRRPMEGLLSGLWEFPGGEWDGKKNKEENLTTLLKERMGIQVTDLKKTANILQILSHRQLHIEAFKCRWAGRLKPKWYTNAEWFSRKELKETGLPAGMLKIAKMLLSMDKAGKPASARSFPHTAPARAGETVLTSKIRFDEEPAGILSST